MPKERDFQRKRVYAAEREVDAGPKMDFDTVGGLVEKVMRSKWWQRRCAIRQIELRMKQGGTWLEADRIDSNRAFIRLADGDSPTWSELDIIHELAHILLPPSKDPTNNHGRYWARAFYDLSLRFRGKKAARELVAAYLKHGVRCEPPPNLRDLF